MKLKIDINFFYKLHIINWEKMEVLVINVGIDSMDTYTEEISEFLVRIQLKSGKKLTIAEIGEFDLRPYKNQKIEVLIGAGGVEVIDTKLNPDVDISYHSIIKGKFIEHYKIPSKWRNYGNEIRSVIETPDGIYIVGKLDTKMLKLKDGDEIVVDTRRYDLLDWYPLE